MILIQYYSRHKNAHYQWYLLNLRQYSHVSFLSGLNFESTFHIANQIPFFNFRNIIQFLIFILLPFLHLEVFITMRRSTNKLNTFLFISHFKNTDILFMLLTYNTYTNYISSKIMQRCLFTLL
jgi:hypothetical protein